MKRRNSHTPKALLATCVVLLFVIIGICVLCIRRATVNFAETTIRGIVVDANTERPIPRAKIIVTAWGGGFYGLGNAKHSHFLTMSDTNGSFVVDADVNFRVRKLHVEASSPSNKYVLVVVSNGLIAFKC